MANASIRYGTKIRKSYSEIKKKKQADYKCERCGRILVQRINTGIWKCKHCSTVYAGAAYSLSSEAGEKGKKLIDNLYHT
ncbi:MAG: 50S ribosomal protein L37ae [Candidatus Marsarchaeota archaeon]|nr:50S ribosomal protein L37ae [Candidatus Marsarchaeota archaeon]MCL5094494.1 50S ribosomal protein L37ae [Candidatus Marsarchaeota archaeon]